MKRWLTFAALSGLIAVAFLYKPTLPSFCTMKRITGIGCPGCGMTRSVIATAHGNLRTAVKFHAFGPFVFVVAVVLWVAVLFGRMPNMDHPAVTRILLGFVAILMAYWVVRLFLKSVP